VILLLGGVRWWLSWWTFRRDVALLRVSRSSNQRTKIWTHSCHATINNKISTGDEAALIACQEQNGIGLLDGFTKATSGEVHFAAGAFDSVVAEPVLEEWCAFGELVNPRLQQFTFL
jgi:hypothetical protein